jgi:hypothetical protein
VRVLPSQVVDVSGRALETAQRIEADVSVLGFDLLKYVSQACSSKADEGVSGWARVDGVLEPVGEVTP